MLVDQFGRMYIGLLDNRVCLRLGVCQNGVPVSQHFLITFDLLRSLHAKLPQQLFNLLFIDNDIRL